MVRTALAPWLFAAAIVAPGVPTNPNLPITTSCWIEARPFESLRFGVFDYCRGHLGYKPGALDCLRIFDQVCWVFLPPQQERTQTRTVNLKSLIECPDGPEPPVCPRLTL